MGDSIWISLHFSYNFTLDLYFSRLKMSSSVGIGIQFCGECNNILYPKEDRVKKILLYACRNCEFVMESANPCVYKNMVLHKENELLNVHADVAQDPTLPRTTDHSCPMCHHKVAVFFQAQSTNSEDMNLYFCCANENCGHRWTRQWWSEGVNIINCVSIKPFMYFWVFLNCVFELCFKNILVFFECKPH